MDMAKIKTIIAAIAMLMAIAVHAQTFILNADGYFNIPGGVVSGTALIRPDFPELLEFPFLWQQTEYVLGGGSSHYMFLVLAACSQ